MELINISNLVKVGAKTGADLDFDSMKFTARLIAERAQKRGWQVAHFESNLAVLFIDIPGKKMSTVFSSSPQTMSYPSVKVVNDKYLTSKLLESAGLPTPREVLIRDVNAPNLKDFIKQADRVVVKPLDMAHGNGVITDVKSQDGLTEAVKDALAMSKKSSVLVQQQYEGCDIRVICIDYKYVNAITRIPARVTGDGVSTIEQLIEIENKTSERGENYKASLNFIDIKRARQYLGEEGIKRVPARGEKTPVVGISNIGVGGERQNVSENIPDWMKEMAVKASLALQMPVSGVDFIVKRLPSKTSKIEELEPVILEVNGCPSLPVYDDLHSPEQDTVIDKYLDYLEEIATPSPA